LGFAITTWSRSSPKGVWTERLYLVVRGRKHQGPAGAV